MELPDVQWRALTLVGRLQLARSRPDDARDAFDGAIALIEGMRSRNPGREEARSRFFADRLAPYQERIAMALAASNVAEALSFAERSKARALLDVIRGDGAADHQGDDRRRAHAGARAPHLAELGQQRARRGGAARSRQRDAGVGSAADSATRNASTTRSFNPVCTPRTPSCASAAPRCPSSAPPRRNGCCSGPGVGDRRIRRRARSDLRVCRHPLGPQRVHAERDQRRSSARQVHRFRDQLANRDLRAVDAARRSTIWSSVRCTRHSEDTTNLIIVPDGVLWNLPFQALQSSAHRYVIEDMAISYAPSITVLREMMQLRGAARGAAGAAGVGQPRGGPCTELPESEYEVRQVAQIYGASSRVYVGAEAREDRWKSEAPDYRVLHLATHGVLDNTSPLYSHLLLAPPEGGSNGDGLLEAWEIMNVPLRPTWCPVRLRDRARQGRRRARACSV